MKTLQNILLTISLLLFTLTYAQNDIKARVEFEEAENQFNENNFSEALRHVERAESLIGKWTPKVSFIKIESLNKIVDLDFLDSEDSKELISEVKLYMDYSSKQKDKIVIEKFKVVYAIDEMLKQLSKLALERKMPEYEQGNAASSKGNYKTAMNFWNKAVLKGNSSAMYEIGFLYNRGVEGFPSDQAKAIEWFGKASAKGNDKAAYKMGIAYYHGEGVKRDFTKAMEWFLKAAARGSDDAMNEIGNFYYYELGVPLDYTKALNWYLKAGAKGNSDAMYRSGYLYSLGRGVAKDGTKAMVWFLKAAEKGNAIAMYNIGVSYYYGDSVIKNYAKAMEWYTKSADNGNNSALYSVGSMYKKGEGVTKDYAKALEWYLKANEKGKIDSTKEMSEMYAEGGFGIKKDKKKAVALMAEHEAKKSNR